MITQKKFDEFIRKHSNLFTPNELVVLRSNDQVAIGQFILKNSQRLPRDNRLINNFLLPAGSEYRGILKDIHLYKMLLPNKKIKDSFLYATNIGSVVFSSSHYTCRADYPYFLLSFTYQGSGILEYEGQSFEIKPGDGFIIDGRRPHCYYATNASGWGYDIIEFNGRGVSEYYAAIDKSGSHKFSFAQGSRFIFYLQELKTQLIQQEEPLLHYTINKLLTCLLTEILYLYQAAKMQDIPSWLKAAITYIKKHYQNHLSLELLAEEVSISKYHLARTFKRYTGKTFTHYLGDIRFLQAKQYLISTQLPVSAIAELVGYQSIPYFISLFKSKEGMTPHQFRKSNQGIFQD